MRILFILFLTLLVNVSFAQDENQTLLDRFNKCDSTITTNEVLTLLFHYRKTENKTKNNGAIEEIQKLMKDSLFSKVETKCNELLKENPLNHTGLYFLTISQLRMNKKDNLECQWNKAENVYKAIMKSGKGTKEQPYFALDINDSKTLISQFWTEGTIIDSISSVDEINIVHITSAEKKREKIYFSFDKEVSIRNLTFNYERDFNYYLEESKRDRSKYNYSTLLTRFLNFDKSLSNNEVLALLIGFTANKNYKPYGNVDKEREIMSLIGSKEYKKSLDISEKLLKTNPLNFTALIEEGFALMKINDDKTEFPSFSSRQVVDAILWSGDGSYNSPYFVLSPIDGQTIIKYIFGESIGTMGSGSDENGYFLDILEMNTEKESINQYFIIEHAVKNSQMHKEIEQAIKNKKK